MYEMGRWVKVILGGWRCVEIFYGRWRCLRYILVGWGQVDICYELARMGGGIF